MRNLTIKRQKKYTACLVSQKVYIEDPISGDTTINNVLCRKIGVLKNGEEKTFQIDDRAAKVFVITDSISKKFCNEFYPIPAGLDDVYLTGACKLDLSSANAFRFDNNDSEEVLENRKTGKRNGVVILIIALVVGFLIGILKNSDSFFPASDEVFTKDGMSITLTDEFEEEREDGFTSAYYSDYASVLTIKEEFATVPGSENFTIEDYAMLIAESNSLNYADFAFKNGIATYEFSADSDGTEFYYFVYLYKASDSFWLIQFTTFEDEVAKYRSTVEKWADSIVFD